jgi:hypothetical protein
MDKNKLKEIQSFYQRVKSANKELTKKELFKDLLNRLYIGNEEIIKIVDAISSGAEKAIINIPREDKLHRGSADTLYNKIIIEFENDLKKTYTHAKEQLAGYLLGQFNSGEGYNFTLIASDFINWKILVPDVTQLDKLETLKEHELILNEVESSSFTLTEYNAEAFYLWIDRFLFREEKQKATLQRIEEAFGYKSPVFIQSFRELIKHFRDVKNAGEVQVAFEQWNKSLSIAYGTFEATEEKFLIQTYLSIFSKMLAYTILTDDDYIDDDEVKQIIDGSIFDRYKIENFVEHDFYYWVKSEDSFYALRDVFRRIAQEISNFDFHDVDEDVLKGIYQDLVDLDTRHALGEYYTPDWLCERITGEFKFTKEDKILDPSCGSGSFLRAVISQIRKLNPDVTIENLNRQIYGIDIHPLSVQIAKTTLLLAFGKKIAHLKKPIHFNIILANTLAAPIEEGDLFGSYFEMPIDGKKYPLVNDVFKDIQLFNDATEICDKLAEDTANEADENIKTFTNIFKRQTKKENKPVA